MALRDFYTAGRSPVFAANAAIATSHPMATEAGLAVLRSGGNGVDAAVTAAAVLAVVEPAMTAIGGDGFALIAHPGKPLYGLNGSGRAAAALSLDTVQGMGWSEMDALHPHSVTVPGVVKTWESLLASHGTMGLDAALQPAIRAAEDGFIVNPRVHYDWRNCAGKLSAQGAGGAQYLVNGAAPAVGSIHRLPALAETLRVVARDGAKGFYEGAVAADIVATLRARGGVMTEEDLASVSADPCTPVLSPYRGIEVAELPPNGVGITAQIMLNLLERFDLAALEPHGVERFHLEIEAARIAYAIRDAHIGDPSAMMHGVEALIDKAWNAGLAATIDPSHRNEALPAPDPKHQSDTTYLSVVDRDGMAVSLINSIYHGFGSGIVTEKTGITLQNRGAGFNLTPGHANALAGGKRPLHTIIPAMAMENGEAKICFGVMGGAYQPVGHAHVISNMVDYGMDAQAALDSPRIFWGEDGVLQIEPTLGATVSDGLAGLGHPVGPAAGPIGGGQIIEIDRANGVLIAGSEPRKDGCAMGF